MRTVTGLVAFLFPFLSFAGFYEDLDTLNHTPAKYEVIGTICEQVAKLRMEEAYQQPVYTVVTGIAYGDSSRTIGELDVVVFENHSHGAIKIAEVKCWNDMRGGLNKALDQRQRFLKTLGSRKGGLFFQSTDDGRHYDQGQFSGAKDFISIAQKGARNVGYDAELDYTLEELMRMRTMVMQCQKQGQCAQAPR